MTYKALNCQAPIYITELLTLYKPKRSLRSASQKMLEVPKSNTRRAMRTGPFQLLRQDFGTHFPYISFKSLLKTFLFHSYYQ